MAIAPLQGKPFRLLFVRRAAVEWPRYRAADVRTARLSSRARRQRRRQMGRIALLTALISTLVVAAVTTALWFLVLRG